MKHARWLDHLPLWAVYGAVARTGIYEPWEIVFMAAPLALAAMVELLRKDLSRWRVPLELAVLGWTALDLFTHPGFFGALVRLLFLLGGLRLALPRQPAQRRQLLLIGFLLFLTTAISNSDLEFFGWTLVWMATATGALLQQAWEGPASLKPGPSARPPFRLVPLWGAGALVLAGGFFLLLPRLNTGWRPFPSFGAALGKLQAGLSDQVDLSQPGAIEGNHEVVMRVVPPEGLSPEAREALGRRLAYLRGLALERVDGQRWEPEGLTPWPPVQLGNQQSLPVDPGGPAVELFLNPTPRGVVPLPYGTRFAGTPFAARLRRGEGGSLRVPFPLTQGIPIRITLAEQGPEGGGPASLAAPLEDPRPPSGGRLAELLELQPEHEAARRASQAWAPGILKAPDLASALAAKLRTFTYTLDNPCGTAANPLQDFLERTQAGHCEYFASALALMLRSRGVPARVVNGYRLGAWVPEGGYWLVTQDEAHAWVEYWDPDARAWRLADGTPALAPSVGTGLSGAWTRLSDALTFRWNRYVVRYSGEDQAAGLSTLQSAAKGWSWRWKRPSPWATGAALLIAGAWVAWRLRRRRAGATLSEPRGSRVLAPLLRRTRKLAPPEPGETARRWLGRLAALRPDRGRDLAELADAVDRALYGGAPESELRPRIRAEARAWGSGPG